MWMRSLLCRVIVLALLLSAAVHAEDAPKPPPITAPKDDKRANMDQMRQRFLNRIKEDLGASDEQWQTLLPKLETVHKLSLEARPSILTALFQRNREKAEPKNDVERKTQELQALTDNKATDPETLKAKTLELRDAREKAKTELKKAQDDLRAGLTPRQEAQLTLMALLE